MKNPLQKIVEIILTTGNQIASLFGNDPPESSAVVDPKKPKPPTLSEAKKEEVECVA